MKFSYKFLIAIFLMLLFVIVANIFALKYYAGQYFSDYVSTIKKEVSDSDLTLIDALLKNKDIDPDVIEEYKSLSKDLSWLLTALEKFAKDPKPSNTSLLESLQKSWVPASTIENIIWTNALETFMSNISNFIYLDTTKPEWIFVTKTIRSIVFFNLALISFLLAISYLWVRYSFRPITAIVDNLSNIIYKKEYKNIVYSKKDEFRPLIDTINNLNRSLSLQEKIRSDFLSDLSHEIKTPITAVKCYLEWIEDWVIKTDEKNMKLLYDEIERLIKITNSVMEFEKEESRNFWDIFVEKLDFSELVETASDEYIPVLSKNSQSIVSYVPRPFNIQTDKDKLKQLLHNIFSNFLKYSWKWTTLSIKAHNRKNRHVLIFSDNWKWVSFNEMPFLKEKFYKAEKSRNKSKSWWLWIGLSVIDKIAKLHWWELTITSQEWKWFELRVELPR